MGVSHALTVDGQNVINMPLTKLSLQIGDETVSWEMTKEDCTVHEVIRGLYTVMLGTTYQKESIICAMKQFAKEWEND